MNRIQRLLAGVAILLLAACSTALPVAAPTEKPGEPATSVPTQAPIPSQTAAPTALPLAQQVTLTTLPFTENGKAPDYTIQLQIPALETVNGINDPRSDKFNEEVNILIQVAVDQFRKGLAEQPAMPISAGSFFDVRHVLISPPGSNIISLQIKIEGMSDGAAHPYHNTVSFNYDLEKGEQIRLSQLFLHGVNHLQTIADYCKAELSKRDIGFEQFAAGADPTEENYAVWNLSTEGLVIVFNEYQVTAYAAGPQTIIIPFDKLEKIISPDGLLAEWKR